MNGRERAYRQISELTFTSTDLRSYSLDPEFRELVWDTRDVRSRWFDYFYRQGGNQWWDHGRMSWVQHRLEIAAGLVQDNGWRPPGQENDPPLLVDLADYMKHRRELRGY